MGAGADKLGDRMKAYEAREAQRRLMPLLPIVARLDGRGFSRWTQGLARPYDERLSRVMIETTRQLVAELGARTGYTQSDEISLVFYNPDPKSPPIFEGRVQKLVSVLAALATAHFAQLVREHLPERADRLAHFDCRVWNVPTIEEAANALLWREFDATKNSISMAARAYYAHAELHGKKGSVLQEMLWQKGVNWNDYPAFFKRGTYVQRRTTQHRFTAEELDALPERHAARCDPDLVVERSEVVELSLPPLGSIVNRAELVCLGAQPQTAGPSVA